MRFVQGDSLAPGAQRPDWSAATEISLDLHQSYYDCLYIAFARRLILPLITADLKFVSKDRQADLAVQTFSLGSLHLLEVSDL